MKPLAERIKELIISTGEPVHLQDIYDQFPTEEKTTIRGRVYSNLGKRFIRVSEGVYAAIGEDCAALAINGCGRSLEGVPDASIDMIYADHPWSDDQHKGGNRAMVSSYSESSFKYSLDDFKAKFRVLKKGAFLIENLPQENERNFEYLYQIKKMAIEAGFKYYALIPWVKGKLVSCTGRSKKNREFLMIFTKGKPRNLRLDHRSGKNMSGSAEMLPTEFNHQPISPRKRVHQSEKPVSLFKEILPLFSKKGEIILDQFAGSFNLMRACLDMGYRNISYELSGEIFRKSLAEK